MLLLLIFSFCSSFLLFPKRFLGFKSSELEGLSKISFTLFFFESILLFVDYNDMMHCLLQWWRDPVLTLWSLEYISLIYLCKHHYLFSLYKSEDLFSSYNKLLPIRLFLCLISLQRYHSFGLEKIIFYFQLDLHRKLLRL